MFSSSAITIRTALLSVSDKRGIVELAVQLHQHKVRILSTGGTAAALRAAGIPVTAVSEVTGQTEIMDGRVKTLHPKIHGGLLGRRDVDANLMQSEQIPAIDLLVVNLYPFTQTIADPDCSLAAAIEQIDIGGPAMLRAACKNHAWVTTITNPDDYPELLQCLPQAPVRDRRQQLALQGFQMTASYDAAISAYLQQQFAPDRAEPHAEQTPAQSDWPSRLQLDLQLREPALRYGENPHQSAALYTPPGAATGIVNASQLQGKALSYNNWMDADAAWQTMQAVAATRPHQAACVIVKHANPCGAALADTITSAYDLAFQCDRTSAFGGIIAINRSISAEFAEQLLQRQFAEVLIAPDCDDAALGLLASKPNLRVLVHSAQAASAATAEASSKAMPELRRIDGGYLVQQADLDTVSRKHMQVVSDRHPDEQQWQDLLFAWQLVRQVKSNAVVYARDGHSLGIGAGQMSRIDSAMIAVHKAEQAGWSMLHAAMASEAFFPFRDSIDTAHAAGVSCVIQPGGSMRDQQVIDAVNEHGMTMVFTGRRHFRH
ncbi:MAG: bifunctional phosphoribosylaminoimidazolecarboxamide formyltransferase/IMP cyclohydrolase [Gammaproteobacteria bacterium]|jgi:phosphoribosylaminoimidazolecarboxamide formyltransferase/IMP cyclohydrolase|nr:bifunctional phosphoribosylaminoimidazolecarboxamide formyltransferase/IMP cyclohydrolase [Gammaproteobacteria bacterium]